MIDSQIKRQREEKGKTQKLKEKNEREMFIGGKEKQKSKDDSRQRIGKIMNVNDKNKST